MIVCQIPCVYMTWIQQYDIIESGHYEYGLWQKKRKRKLQYKDKQHTIHITIILFEHLLVFISITDTDS